MHHRGRMTARAAATVAALATAALGLGGAPVAAAGVEGLEVDSKTTYRLDPKGERVIVTMTAQLENTMPSQTVGAYIRTPYFAEYAVPLLGPVADVTATSDVGGQLTTRTD